MIKSIVITLFVLMALWGCDTTTGCLGDFQSQFEKPDCVRNMK